MTSQDSSVSLKFWWSNVQFTCFGSDGLRENQSLIGDLRSDETAVLTKEVPDFLFLGVFPNWTMVHALVAHAD